MERQFPTIGSLFAGKPGTAAYSLAGGNSIWVDPSRISGNLNSNAALLLHESLHNLGYFDHEIQAALGLQVSGITDNITQRLYTDCIKGKDNQ